MGTIHRIKKQLNQPIAIANTKVTVNGCQIMLAHPNRRKAVASAREFPAWLASLSERARCVNIGDLYAAHFAMLERLEAGESITGKAQ